MNTLKKHILLLSFFLAFFVLLSRSAVSEQYTEKNNQPAFNSVTEFHQWLAKGRAEAFEVSRQKDLSTTEALSGQSDYDVLFYNIKIRLDDTTQSIFGEVGCQVRIEEATDLILLDLTDNMIIDSIYSATATLTFTHVDDIVTINLDRIYNIGELVSFTIAYHGQPAFCGLQGLKFDTRYGNPIISTLSEPFCARSWWPCKDQPEDKADSFYIALEVDTAFFAASNGRLDSTIATGNNSHTFYYSHRYPMASYLFALTVMRDSVWYDSWTYKDIVDSMPIMYAVFPDRYNYSRSHGWNLVPDILTILSDKFGVYPFADEKYGLANFQAPYGMEHQTISFLPGSNPGFDTLLIVHETAHQWWGDMITCAGWRNIWLNEGWATYSEALYLEETIGPERFRDYMDDIRYMGEGSVIVNDTNDVDSIFNVSLVYDKAAWVLHMLRHQLGDSLFFAGVHVYYDSPYKYGAATTENFRDIFSTATGVDLTSFFEQWVYGEGHPDYQWSWWAEPTDTTGLDLFITVKQTQITSPQIFSMDVDFVFDFVPPYESDTETFRVDSENNLFKINVPRFPVQVSLDPDDWILCAKEYVRDTVVRIVTPKDGLNDGLIGTFYTDSIKTRGGSGIFQFKLINNTAPPKGLTLNPSNGIISGIPEQAGKFLFNISIVDAIANPDNPTKTDTASFILTIEKDNPVSPLNPDKYYLADNYPNPFNSGTTIPFGVPVDSKVTITVYNILGQKIKTLTSKWYQAGRYDVFWSGRDVQGNEVTSGIYFYRMTAGDNTLSHKMQFIK